MNVQTMIWIIRHGEPLGTAGRCCGRLDPELSSVGHGQAGKLAERFASERLAAIYSSNLRRAFQTASIISERHNLGVEAVEDLAEINFGVLEGLTFDEIALRYSSVFDDWMQRPAEVRFPNGENFSEMQARVLRVASNLRIRHDRETIAIVAHGGVNRVLLAHALCMPVSQMFRISQPYAAVNRIEYTDCTPMVELING